MNEPIIDDVCSPDACGHKDFCALSEFRAKDWHHCSRQCPMVAKPVYAPGDHIHGWMDAHELNWLYETGKQMQSVVEIGSWQGRSTFALCTSGCPRVIAVDHFQGSTEHQRYIDEEKLDLRAAFYGNVGHFDNLTVVEEPSAKAAEIVAEKYGKVDMVFIDASHDEQSVEEDIRLWAPLARKIVAGHDYGYASVQGPVVKYFGRGRDRRCNAIWAMIVEGANMAEIPEIDTNKDATDEDAEKLIDAIPATPVASVVLPPDVDYTVMAGRPDH